MKVSKFIGNIWRNYTELLLNFADLFFIFWAFDKLFRVIFIYLKLFYESSEFIGNIWRNYSEVLLNFADSSFFFCASDKLIKVIFIYLNLFDESIEIYWQYLEKLFWGSSKLCRLIFYFLCFR